MAEETWDEIITANLKSLFAVAKACMRPMIGKRSGRIIAVASLSGITGLPGQTHYAASKGGMISFVKALALETARFGITVNAVAPANVQSPRAKAIRSPERLRHIAQTTPVGRLSEPGEIAEAVLFLCGKGVGYITGVTLDVNGGATMV